MALFMDTHTIDGQVSIDNVAQAHAADLRTQDAYGVHYLRYWVDQEHGKIFCLVDAPDADAAAPGPREAQGLVADEISPVAEGACPRAVPITRGPRPADRGPRGCEVSPPAPWRTRGCAR